MLLLFLIDKPLLCFFLSAYNLFVLSMPLFDLFYILCFLIVHCSVCTLYALIILLFSGYVVVNVFCF